MWNDRLAALAAEYPTAILSVVSPDGYPRSVRCRPRLDAARQVAVIEASPPLNAEWCGKACLLFHQFDARLEGLRQIVVVGTLEGASEGDAEDSLVLRVDRFVTANGRSDTDRMPHASSPIHIVQFYLLGRRNARAYLARRGAPWPPIPYAAISRELDKEDF